MSEWRERARSRLSPQIRTTTNCATFTSKRADAPLTCARRHGSDALRSGRSGLPALRAQDWVGEIGKGLTTVTVKVRQPEVTHIVKIQDFENWLNSRGKTPAEIVLKSRLRQLLGMVCWE